MEHASHGPTMRRCSFAVPNPAGTCRSTGRWLRSAWSLPRGGGGNFRHCPVRLDGPSTTGIAMSLAIEPGCAPCIPSVTDAVAADASRGTLACTLALRHAGPRRVELRYELVGGAG